MKNRIKAPVMAMMAAFTLSGCNLLDVDNPNSLVEESIRQLAAANGVANGSLQLASEAIADVWEGPAVTGDELYWIGSRDAWGQLDQGFISNGENEFTDAAFPTLGRGVWMAQNAVEILAGHVADNPGVDEIEKDYGRTLMFRGMILMVTAESQDDMTFSWKMVDGPPVSSGNATIGNPEGSPIAVPTMVAVMDLAITSLTDAMGIFNGLGEDELATIAQALRARAYHSRVIMQARDAVGGALAFPNATADAAAVIADVGNGSDWTYNLAYSSASNSCDMCGNVNDRKENQVDLSLVTVDASNDIDGIRLQDPIDGVDDPSLVKALNQWKGGSYLNSGNQYPDLTVVNERLMHLILAEDELANGNSAGFETHINHIRDMDGSTDFVSGGAGMPTDVAMLQHMRRVNTVLMGLRLQDMYRWGLAPATASGSASSAVWAPGSDAVQRRGSMLPITIIEVRANCYLNGQGCGS